MVSNHHRHAQALVSATRARMTVMTDPSSSSDTIPIDGRLSTIYRLSRWVLALIFVYHGLVPKILFRNAQEIEMNTAFAPAVEETFALISSGVAELLLAVLLVWLYRWQILNYAIIAFGCLATLAIVISLPHLLANAFNPFSTNLALVALAGINCLSATAVREHDRP